MTGAANTTATVAGGLFTSIESEPAAGNFSVSEPLTPAGGELFADQLQRAAMALDGDVVDGHTVAASVDMSPLDISVEPVSVAGQLGVPSQVISAQVTTDVVQQDATSATPADVAPIVIQAVTTPVISAYLTPAATPQDAPAVVPAETASVTTPRDAASRNISMGREALVGEQVVEPIVDNSAVAMSIPASQRIAEAANPDAAVREPSGSAAQTVNTADENDHRTLLSLLQSRSKLLAATDVNTSSSSADKSPAPSIGAQFERPILSPSPVGIPEVINAVQAHPPELTQAEPLSADRSLTINRRFVTNADVDSYLEPADQLAMRTTANVTTHTGQGPDNATTDSIENSQRMLATELHLASAVASAAGSASSGAAATIVASDTTGATGVELVSNNMFHATPSGIITAASTQQQTVLVNEHMSAPMGFTVNQTDSDQPLVDNIRWMLGENVKRATVNVTPNNLGPITIHLDVENQIMNVSIVTSNSVVKEAMDALLPRIRESLAGDSYESVSVDVTTGQERRRGGQKENSVQYSSMYEGKERSDSVAEFGSESIQFGQHKQKSNNSFIDTYV